MFRRLFRHRAIDPRDVEREMREEIEAHIALGVEHLVRRGVDPADAERQIRARFGDLATAMPALVASAKRRARTIERREHFVDGFRDVRFGLRQLRRSPGFTLGVLFSLGFGIGASATVFSWMEGLILRPFPAIYDVDRLISVRPAVANGWGISIPELEDWRQQSRTVTGLAGVALFRVRRGSARPGVQIGSAGDAVRAAELLNVETSIAIHFDTFQQGDDGQQGPVDSLASALTAHPTIEFLALHNGEARWIETASSAHVTSPSIPCH